MSKKTLNKTNLETLSAEQLAALLMEVSMGSADIKRRLRLELSHNLGPAGCRQTNANQFQWAANRQNLR
jgi:hypothetical protein